MPWKEPCVMHESVSMTSTSEYIDTRSAALLGGFAFAVEAAAMIVSGPFLFFFSLFTTTVTTTFACLPLLSRARFVRL